MSHLATDPKLPLFATVLSDIEWGVAPFCPIDILTERV